MDTNNQAALQQFDSLIGIRFQLYNSLFTSLPFHHIENTGILLSMFLLQCEAGYNEGRSPKQIIDRFISQYTQYRDSAAVHSLLFRFIQYAERQVVLFDALEDAAFPQMHRGSDSSDLRQLINMSDQQQRDSHKNERQAEVRLVLTAHPTQFYNGAVLGIISDLSESLKAEQPQEINAYLRQLGRTPFFQQEKPTPFDEAQNLMWYLEYIFYPAAGEVMYDLHRYGISRDTARRPAIRIGFWPGGDRDGNQFVRTETTLRVANALHRRIMRCYHKESRELKRRLTFKLVDTMVTALERYLYGDLYEDKGEVTIDGLKSQLLEIRKVLAEKHNSLFIELVDGFLEKIEIFGLHFASLDVRQDSSIHGKALDAVAVNNGALPQNYAELNDGEKLAVLCKLSAQETAIPETDDEVVKDTFEVIPAIRGIQRRNGEAGAHRYIISHCTSALNVMEVYALFLLTGWSAEDMSVDIVPLFETIDDLAACGEVMKSLYANPVYRGHLKRRGDRQTIMLGFSDGTKDGGYLMANWAIYKAKEALTAIARAENIDVSFFDGRGGPPARGGGKTQKFYASMGSNIAGRDIQLTIQGQTISSKFGTIATAKHNIEQLLAAGIAGRTRAAAGPTLNEAEDKLLSELSDISYKSYVALKAQPGFLEYLNEVSPMRFYADTNIGSRPAKRGAGKLRFEDLRAIPYVGAWSQLKQNVPGFYGVGTALKTLDEAGRWEEVQHLYTGSAYFRTLIDNCEMAMKKCFFPLTRYLADDPRYSTIWNEVYNEFQLTEKTVLKLTGGSGLMSAQPVSAASIELRDRIVLPLLTIQQYALEELRQKTDREPTLEKLVIRCSFGIINASRNAV
jgi:phosphoenolpyruvate carboxylase